MGENDVGQEHQQMWEQLDKELRSLIEGGALRQAITRLTATLEMMGSAEAAPLRAQMLARRAELLLDLDDGEAALVDARKAISLGLRDASSYGPAGWASYHLDKPEKAREYFDRALSDAPDEVTLLTGRALTLMDLNQFDLARADLTHALHQDDGDAGLLAIRGEVYLRMGDLDGAGADLEKAFELDAGDPEIALSLARLYLVGGEIEKALSVIDYAVEEDDEFALEAILLRSHLRLMSGASKPARSDALRASNLYSDEAFSFVQLAHVELAEGNLNMAQKAAERAVMLDPSLPDSYMVRGAASQMAGDAEAAKKDFERASRAPAELPHFLLGPAQDATGGAAGMNQPLLDMLSGQGAAGFDPAALAGAFGQGAKPGAIPGGMPGGMDPMNMLDQIFNDSGEIRGPLKPFFEMAFKNAPKIMKNLPPSMLGGVNKEELEGMDLSDLSSEEVEERMREFYQLMKSGKNPFDPKSHRPGEDDDN